MKIYYSYSHDEENYHGQFESIEEACAEAFADDSRYSHFWIGQCVPPPVLEAIDAAKIIDDIICQEEWSLPMAENSLNPTKEQIDDLDLALKETVSKWFTKNDLWPKWWLVENVKKMEME